MAAEFRREYLLRLPLPLAQLYTRAYNAKDARSRHDNSFYLLEALAKLAVAPAASSYLQELEGGAPRLPGLDGLLAQLALPSFGQWVAMLRELARHFGGRPDAATHPLGHLRGQLDTPRRDSPGLLALYRRIKNGPDGQPSNDTACTLLQVLEALVQYRNGVFGHGGPRFDSFYDREMGPLLFPCLNDLLAEGTFDPLGARGSRLVYLTEMRVLDQNRVEVGLRELTGLQGERLAPLELPAAQAGGLQPNRVAVLWPGRPRPLRLDPLLLYREGDTADEVLFLNRDRRGRQVEYLSYTTGRTERDRTTAPALAALLSRVTGQPVTEAGLQALAEESRAETPPAEGPTPPDSAAGRMLGDYEVLAEIGRGGMGVVYLARQTSLGRLVALKMLPADLAGDEVALARFRREIRHLARCDHPNIVKVLTSGIMPDGQLYYTMEYIPGCDLEQVWREFAGAAAQGPASSLGQATWTRAVLEASRKRRAQTAGRAAPGAGPAEAPRLPLPPLPDLPPAAEDPGGYVRRVVDLTRQAALALQGVHEQNIVHRDVKPANLMLTPDGSRVVLMDFGLAKGQSLALTRSRSGGFLGTLRYAAPEQLAAATLTVGPAADVRALGCVLWELLTRRRLFGDAADEAQLAQRVHDEDVPRLRAVDRGMDRDLDAIVARATERRVGDRVATAGALAGYLQLFLEDKPLPIRTPGTREMVRRWVRAHKALVGSAAAAAAVVLLTVVVAFALIARSRDLALRAADEANRLSARLARDKGLVLCDQGDTAGGLLWLARSLEIAPPDDTSFVRVVRANLGGWRRRLPALTAVHPAAGALDCSVAAVSPDGRTFVTGGVDGTVQAWDPASGKSFGRRLGERAGAFSALAFSPDGRLLAIAGGDHTLRLWQVRSGEQIGPPLAPGGRVSALAFSPDGKTLLTGGVDGMIRLWDLAKGEGTRRGLPTGSPVLAAAFSPDGRLLLTGGEDGVARLWDAILGEPLGNALRHAGPVQAVAFSPDGRTALTGSRDNTARLWEVDPGRPLSPPLQHQGAVQAVAFSPDGTLLLTASSDSTARLWQADQSLSTETGRPVGLYLRHPGPVRAASFGADGKVIQTVDAAGTARLWEAPDRFAVSVHEVQDPNAQPDDLASSPADPVVGVALSRDGGALVTAGPGHVAQLWREGTPVAPVFEHKGRVLAAALAPEGDLLVTGAADNAARLWAVPPGPIRPGAGGPLPRFVLQSDGPVRAVAVSPDGRTVLTGSQDRTARRWDVRTGQAVGEPWVHRSGVVVVAFSPDGGRAAIGCQDGEVRVWDPDSGKPCGPPLAHPEGVSRLRFAPDSRAIVTATPDGTTRVWDASTGQLLTPPRRYETGRAGLALSPDGRLIGAVGEDGRTRLWDAETGESVGCAMQGARGISALDFTPDGGRVLAVVPGGRAVLHWAVASVIPPDPALVRLWAQAITGQELDAAGALRPLDATSWGQCRERLSARETSLPPEQLPAALRGQPLPGRRNKTKMPEVALQEMAPAVPHPAPGAMAPWPPPVHLPREAMPAGAAPPDRAPGFGGAPSPMPEAGPSAPDPGLGPRNPKPSGSGLLSPPPVGPAPPDTGMAPSPGGGPGAFPRPGGGPRPAPGRASPEPGPTPGVPLPQRLAPPGDSAPESLEALIAKQSKLAQTLSENYRRAYVAGQAVSVEDTCLWQRRLAELRRDRKGKQGVPLSAIKEYWSQMVAVEESIRTQQRFGAGFIDMDQSEARFLRLQAEYWLRSAEAESTSDPAPRRTEERVSLARERRDLARTVYDARLREFREAGRGLDLEALCRWSCRWPDAQGDTIEFTAAKIAPLEEHLVRMNELKKLTEGLVREGKPAAAPIELTRAEFFCREAEYLLSRARNDPKAGLARDCRLLASEVYDHTRKALTRPVYGKKMTRPSELVYLWSRRWLETQRDMSDQKASQVIAYSEHLGRMEDLRALATKALMEGARDITQSDVDASEFYVCEAKAWLLESSPRGRGVAVEPGPEPTPVPRPPSR